MLNEKMINKVLDKQWNNNITFPEVTRVIKKDDYKTINQIKKESMEDVFNFLVEYQQKNNTTTIDISHVESFLRQKVGDYIC